MFNKHYFIYWLYSTPKRVSNWTYVVAFRCLIIFPGHRKWIYLPKNGFLHPQSRRGRWLGRLQTRLMTVLVVIHRGVNHHWRHRCAHCSCCIHQLHCRCHTFCTIWVHWPVAVVNRHTAFILMSFIPNLKSSKQNCCSFNKLKLNVFLFSHKDPDFGLIWFWNNYKYAQKAHILLSLMWT